MNRFINPITGNPLNDSFDKVLTFGLTDAETEVLAPYIPEGTTILSCNHSFEDLLSTRCTCIVFAPSKMSQSQISQMNMIYENEERILIINADPQERKFTFHSHTIDLSGAPDRRLKRLRLFLESIKPVCFSNCDGYMLNDGFVFVDIETTGLDQNTDELIFLSAVRVANMQITDTFETLVKPSKTIPKEIEKLCAITNEMVATAFPAEDAVKTLIDRIGMDIFVTYDKEFTNGFLNPVFKKLGYEVNMKPNLDLLSLLRKLYANQLFSVPNRINSYAAKIGIDITETPYYEQKPKVLTDVLCRLRKEYEYHAVSDIEKLY